MLSKLWVIDIFLCSAFTISPEDFNLCSVWRHTAGQTFCTKLLCILQHRCRQKYYSPIARAHCAISQSTIHITNCSAVPGHVIMMSHVLKWQTRKLSLPLIICQFAIKTKQCTLHHVWPHDHSTRNCSVIGSSDFALWIFWHVHRNTSTRLEYFSFIAAFISFYFICPYNCNKTCTDHLLQHLFYLLHSCGQHYIITKILLIKTICIKHAHSSKSVHLEFLFLVSPHLN